MIDWIKCADRMPPDMEPVIVTVYDKYNPPRYTWIGRLNDGKWELLIEADNVYDPTDEWIAVTHWTHMPEPAED